jgi:hypothetical protein
MVIIVSGGLYILLVPARGGTKVITIGDSRIGGITTGGGAIGGNGGSGLGQGQGGVGFHPTHFFLT